MRLLSIFKSNFPKIIFTSILECVIMIKTPHKEERYERYFEIPYHLSLDESTPDR